VWLEGAMGGNAVIWRAAMTTTKGTEINESLSTEVECHLNSNRFHWFTLSVALIIRFNFVRLQCFVFVRADRPALVAAVKNAKHSQQNDTQNSEQKE